MRDHVNKIVGDAISAQRGAIVNLCWKRPAKTKKHCPHKIEKQVCTSGKLGINYDNQKIVKEKRQNSILPAKNKGLPWGQWQWFPYVIEHKGREYLRLYRAGNKTIVTWFLDGSEVEFEEVEGFLLASEKRPSSGDCFNVKIADMIEIG